ncbi:MAG: 5-bromo-4-chloroindolyl phosphate hydrolysis family protein [Eubacterium sp.]|nr:5-bromo-4-chloroindolyl phosphate hydrolysis family protein [Eubacterium sp.]
MGENRLRDASENVINIIQIAIENNDYSHLASDIRQEVGSFASETGRIIDPVTRRIRNIPSEVGRAAEEIRRNRGKGVARSANADENIHAQNRGTSQNRSTSQSDIRRSAARMGSTISAFVGRQVGKTAAVAVTVFGILFGAIFAASALDRISRGILPSAVVTAVIAVLCALLVWRGIRKSILIRNYEKYAHIAGKAEYIDIEDLAKAASENERKTVANLNALINAGLLRGAHLDDEKKTLILSERAYNLYRQAKTNGKIKKEQAERQAREREQAEKQVRPEMSESEILLEQGNTFIREIRNANDRIPEKEMSLKLYRLEAIVNKIIIHAKQHPGSEADLRKFMNYYIPMTRKLINAYLDLYETNASGDNISATKKEIEDALDSINTAYERLLDSMFSDVAMDISSDIAVMKTMMEQDGLADDRMREKQYR